MKMYFCMPFIIIVFPRCCINNQHDLTTFNTGCSLKDTLIRPRPLSLSLSLLTSLFQQSEKLKKNFDYNISYVSPLWLLIWQI